MVLQEATAVDANQVVMTRGYAVRAERAASINHGTAARLHVVTAGIPAFATPSRPTNYAFAAHAPVMRRGNYGMAVMADPKAKAIRIDKIQRKSGSKKKR